MVQDSDQQLSQLQEKSRIEPGEASETNSTISNYRNSQNSGVTSMSDPAVFQRTQQLVIQSQRDEYEEEQHSRKTSLCCFSCCDLRLACIIVNSIYLVIAGYGLLASAFDFRIFERVEWFQKQDRLYDDEESQRNGFVILGTNNIQYGIAMFFNVVGILGAVLFSKYPILIVALWYCVDTILYCTYLNIVGAVWVGLYAYPHFALFWALRKETITSQNYRETEKYCCCDCCCGGSV